MHKSMASEAIGNKDMGWINVSWVHIESSKLSTDFLPEGRRYNPSDGYFWMGLTTLKVPMELFAENRRRLVAGLR